MHLKRMTIFVGLFAFASLILGVFSTSSQAAMQSCPPVPTQNLKLSYVGNQVMRLQQILNMSQDTKISSSGAGSPGHESTTFGTLTKAAVIKFQNKYASQILAPAGLTSGNGFVGAGTRAQLGVICGQKTQSVIQNNIGTGTGSTLYPEKQTATPTPISTTPVSSSISMRVSTSTPIPAPTTPLVITFPTATSNSKLQWGAYTGDSVETVSTFENMVGKQTNLIAVFSAFGDDFPSAYAPYVGQKGKTLIIFWEPNFGYDKINNGSEDSVIQQFAIAAKAYKYPIILAPFDEMNLNEEAWGYSQNNNTAAKFQTAWKHIHDLFSDATNVKFAITFNNVSVPDIASNQFSDYYPGSDYVDYIGIDGFNFGNPWETFGQVFDKSISQVQSFNKPIYIMSMGSANGTQKASWITEGLGSHIKTYSNVVGWVWFNQNDANVPSSGDNINWMVNSDSASLQAFASVIQ